MKTSSKHVHYSIYTLANAFYASRIFFKASSLLLTFISFYCANGCCYNELETMLISVHKIACSSFTCTFVFEMCVHFPTKYTIFNGNATRRTNMMHLNFPLFEGGTYKKIDNFVTWKNSTFYLQTTNIPNSILIWEFFVFNKF